MTASDDDITALDATALSEAMAAQFPQIQAEAAEAIAALAAKEQ